MHATQRPVRVFNRANSRRLGLTQSIAGPIDETLRNIPVEVRHWLLTLFLMPFVTILFWPAVYALYATILLVVYTKILRGRLRNMRSHWILFGKWFYSILIALFYAFSSFSSTINIGCIMACELYGYITLYNRRWRDEEIVAFSRAFIVVLISIAVFGFIFSTALAGAGLTLDPISGYGLTHRLLILTPPTKYGTYGHSVLLYAGFFIALIGISNLGVLGLRVRTFVTILAAIFVILAGTATGILSLASLFVVLSIESLKLPRFFSVLSHIIFLSALVYISISPDGVTQFMEFVRVDVMRLQASVYGHDFTSGRALLNHVLWDAIQDSPWIGGGHDAPAVQLGLAVVQGRTNSYQANSESSLIGGAAYGLPYLVFQCVVVASPIIGIFSNNIKLRVACSGFIYGTLVFIVSNNMFGQGHVAEALLVLTFSMFLTAISVQSVFGARTSGQPPGVGLNREVLVR